MGSERVRSRERTRKLFQKVIRQTLKRSEELTVSRWAEKYRILDETSSLPGRWTNDVTPYLVEIMDTFNDPDVQQITFCKPTQVGGTEALINMLGWVISQNPSPSMIVYPSDDLAKDISNDKLQPAFKKTPSIREKFQITNSKELKLKFDGMTLYLRGAGSPSKLASKAIKYLFFDEIDKMGGASKKEASPYNLALERTKTFRYSRKIYACSTPTLKTNYIWTLYEQAEERKHFVVPCPHCGEYIELLWKQVKFPKEREDLSISERASQAVYVCQACGCTIADKDKPDMLRKGYWKTVDKACKGKAKSVAYWLNSLYSIFVNWSDAAKEFMESLPDPEKLQNFVNSWLAEPWVNTMLQTDEELVKKKETEYPAFVVPPWARLLTGGVDIQETSLYWTIRAWGDFMTSQNIAHGQVLSFREIERLMNLEYEKPDKTKMIVNLALIDSGYNADDTYDFCVLNGEWAMPAKGASNPDYHFKISKIDKQDSKANGLPLVLVNTETYKDAIASRMQKEKDAMGSWLVHKDCDDEYAKQVTSEHKIATRSGNRMVQRWVKKLSHGDNHYLDCEVYAMAAAEIMGARTMYQEEREEQEPEESQEESWLRKDEGWLKNGRDQ